LKMTEEITLIMQQGFHLPDWYSTT